MCFPVLAATKSLADSALPNLGGPGLWAETGGLVGLLAFASFAVLIYLIYSNRVIAKEFTKSIELKDARLESVLDGQMKERREIMMEQHQTSRRVADSLDDLSKSIIRMQEKSSKKDEPNAGQT